MTDERLDQILKASLDPEIKEEDIFIYKEAKSRKTTKLFTRIGAIAAAAVAILALGIGILGAAAPALAAKLPLIGRIFAETQDQITFSGNYDKATVLTAEDESGALSTLEYTCTDQEYTITASEVYCDGYSIYLSLDVESQERDLTEVQEIYTQSDGETTAAMLYAPLTWTLYDSGGKMLFEATDPNIHILGKAINEHEFAGMIKLDITLDCGPLYPTGYTLKLQFNAIGYDNKVNPRNQEFSEKPADWTDGSWTLNVPVQVDENVKTIEINEKYGAICLKSVMVSDYQVVIRKEVNYIHLSSDDEIDQFLDEHPEDSEFQDMIKDEYEKTGQFTYALKSSDTIVFDQDGNRLQPDLEGIDIATFAVQNKELTSLDIYVFAGEEGFNSWLEAYRNTDALKDAVIHVEVPLE